MSNMTVNDRNSFDRAEHGGHQEQIRRGSERSASAYSGIAAALAVVMCIAAATFMDGWAQFVVIGGILVAVAGLMIAVSPTRRA